MNRGLKAMGAGAVASALSLLAGCLPGFPSTAADGGSDLDGGLDAKGDAGDGSTRDADAGSNTDADAQAYADADADADSGQTCTTSEAGTTCACPANVCGATGTVCQGGQTVATCQKDPQGCFYVASTSTCPSSESCAGSAPDAGCSSTCSNTCSKGQTVCIDGGVATCELGDGGCWAYGAAASCPGVRQTCTGAAGSAACACKADSVCSSLAAACASESALASCAQDAQGCFYEVSSSTCTNGACSGGACCTNACTNGATQCLSGTTLSSCSPAATGCTEWSAGSACGSGLVCERGGTAACADPSWAEWPMPNDPVDVTNGAPHQESYKDNGDGTVTDTVTGLMWQQSPPTTCFSWGPASTNGTAQYYCANLMLGGYTDWRVPTVIELISVLLPSNQTNGSVMMNATFFPGMSALRCPILMTATPAAGPIGGTSSAGWAVFFESTGDPWTRGVPAGGTASGSVICVR